MGALNTRRLTCSAPRPQSIPLPLHLRRLPLLPTWVDSSSPHPLSLFKFLIWNSKAITVLGHTYQGHTYLPGIYTFQLCQCFSNIFDQKFIFCTCMYVCMHCTHTHTYFITECLFSLYAIHLHYTIFKNGLHDSKLISQPTDGSWPKVWKTLKLGWGWWGKKKGKEFPPFKGTTHG